MTSIRLRTKKLLRFHSGCDGMKISIVSNRNVASAGRDLVPTSKKTLPFTNCIREKQVSTDLENLEKSGNVKHNLKVGP